jgi:hypothetical protein
MLEAWQGIGRAESALAAEITRFSGAFGKLSLRVLRPDRTVDQVELAHPSTS